MSASESAPTASELHKSIDQLISEAERQARAAVDAEKELLTSAMQAALSEIEASKDALERAASTLRTALSEQPAKPAATTDIDSAASIKEETPQPSTQAPAIVPVTDRGAHELDVIAHHANISSASGLQSMLRAQPEVTSAQTREFVNGELRLQVSLTNGLDMMAFNAWLAEHGGELVTSTDSVIEVRFAS